MVYQSINPDNGKLLKNFKELTSPQLSAASRTLETAASFPSWAFKSSRKKLVRVASIDAPA